MKNSTSIVIGNATTGNNQIHFRDTSFLTDSNRTHIEECVRRFISFPIPLAFSDLVKMTCRPKEDVPGALWEDIQLNPKLIPDNAWLSFVNELRHQYKMTHPTFMKEFTIPDECVGAYDALAGGTSEVAAYMFYKRVDTFLYDHINSPIGERHISDTFNRLTWHSKDQEANHSQQIKGLKRLSLRDYEASYFYKHLEKCTALYQSMWNYLITLPSALEPAEKENADYSDLPFVVGKNNDKEVTETAKKTLLELSMENILVHEEDFLNFILGNDDDSLNRLQNAGFDTERIRIKAVPIFRVIQAHREMAEAIEALYK